MPTARKRILTKNWKRGGGGGVGALPCPHYPQLIIYPLRDPFCTENCWHQLRLTGGERQLDVPSTALAIRRRQTGRPTPPSASAPSGTLTDATAVISGVVVTRQAEPVLFFKNILICYYYYSFGEGGGGGFFCAKFSHVFSCCLLLPVAKFGSFSCGWLPQNCQ
jgi:hypothetical protein